MRSTRFVVISIIVHLLCFTALALTPTRTVSPENVGETIEVKIGEPAEQAGTADAPVTGQDSKPVAVTSTPPVEVKPEPVVAKPEPVAAPAPKPEPVQEVKKEAPPKKTAVHKVAAAPIAKPAKKAKAVPAPTQDDPEAPKASEKTQDAPVAAEVQEARQEEKPVLTPVKETAPAGVEAAAAAAAATGDDKDTEAKSEDVAKTGDPAPVAVAEEAKSTGELAKGGASKEGAVSYLDLRQMKGNKPPPYPVKARLEKRQGQLELVYRVTKDGHVTDIQVAKSSGHKDLDNEAIKAIGQFRFVPGQEGWARHPVSFTLKGEVVTLPSRLRGKGAQADD